MNSMYHAKSSAHKWGGKPEDYQEIHTFIDSAKIAMPDIRHRAILHNSFGIFLTEKIFGVSIKNSNGKDIPVREIAEKHVIEDLGFIPTVKDWLGCISLKAVPWAGGRPEQLKKNGIKLSRKIQSKIDEQNKGEPESSPL